MISRIKKRWLLALLIAGTQVVCLIAGLAWYANWLHDGLISRMRSQANAVNHEFVDQTVEMIANMNLTELKPGSPNWLRVQRIIERTRLPNEGFLSVIDTEIGRYICHPELPHDSSMLGLRPGDLVLEGSGSDQPVKELNAEESAVAGILQLSDGPHLVAVRDLPSLGIKVVAHQHVADLVGITVQVVGSVWKIGFVIFLIIICTTVLLTVTIVRWFENKLARINEQLEELVEQRSLALMKTRDAVIFGLAKIAESRDDATGGHLDRITTYVELLVHELAKDDPNMTEETIRTITLASSLHDIGKVGIPDSVLLKPGKLTTHERDIIRRHAVIGGDCLMAIKARLGEDDFLSTACDIAFSHHERWDGKGYPFGLKGEDIPLSARIVALADCYDAITSVREYKPSYSHGRARHLIVKQAGKQFDPKIVDAFLRCEEDFAHMVQEFLEESHLQVAA